MKALGFEHRYIRNIRANKGARYEGKIVGGSPEMCRAINSHGFANLKAAIMAYSPYTYVLPIGDARRFNLGTPNKVLRSTERAFAVGPTRKRIAEDILVLATVLGRIIEHKGIVVEEDALRYGRAEHTTWESLKPNNKSSQVKLILSPKQRAKPAASRTRTCTNAAVCIASGECPSRF
jgi:hypothetical protein